MAWELDVERHLDGRVTEPLLDDLRVDKGAQRHGGVGVSQPVDLIEGSRIIDQPREPAW
jgi:hypothetical protein